MDSFANLKTKKYCVNIYFFSFLVLQNKKVSIYVKRSGFQAMNIKGKTNKQETIK